PHTRAHPGKSVYDTPRNGGVLVKAVSKNPAPPDVGKSEQENRFGNDESGLLAFTVLHLLGSFSGARAVGGRLGGGRVGGVGCVRRLTHRTIADRDALDRFRLPGSFRCGGFLLRGGWGRFRVVVAVLGFPAQLRFPAQRGCGARGGGFDERDRFSTEVFRKVRGTATRSLAAVDIVGVVGFFAAVVLRQ